MWHPWGSWWLLLPLVTLVLVGGLLWVLVTISRSPAGATRYGPGPEAEAERLLDIRYAQGEIGDAEYQHRLEVLRGEASPVRTDHPR